MILVLDDFLPHYDVHELHSVTIVAPPGAVMDAVRGVTPREVPVLVALMAIRSLPALLRGRRSQLGRPILDGARTSGFVTLGETAHELVLGAVGRFWQPAGDLRRIEPADFRDFAEPGWAKGAVNFKVEQEGGRTVLSTETRVVATDPSARRRFRRYWRVVYPGSAVIRIAWLRAIRERAEGQAGSSPRSARA